MTGAVARYREFAIKLQILIIESNMRDEGMKRILVVDDEPLIRLVLAEFLLDEGYEVATSSDGMTAIQRLKDDVPPDMVLLDMNMPGATGIEVIAFLRSHSSTSHIPIIIISGCGDAEWTWRENMVARPYCASLLT